MLLLVILAVLAPSTFAVDYAVNVVNQGSTAWVLSGGATGANAQINVKKGDTISFTVVNAAGHRTSYEVIAVTLCFL